MHDVARQHLALLGKRRVGVGDVGAEQLVVVLDAGAQEERTPIVQAQPEAREIARSFVIQALLARAERPDVAVEIEQREGIVVLEHRAALAGARRGRQDVELILDLNEIVHVGCSYAVPTSASAAGPTSARSYTPR